jgi:hypothetical protein
VHLDTLKSGNGDQMLPVSDFPFGIAYDDNYRRLEMSNCQKTTVRHHHAFSICRTTYLVSVAVEKSATIG